MVNSPTFVGRARRSKSRFRAESAAPEGFGSARAFQRRGKGL